VTHLRKMMLEELQRRNYAETTIGCYLRTVEDFSRHFHCSPDRLGPRHIREYQAELFQKRKFSPNTVAQRLAALRFYNSCRNRHPGSVHGDRDFYERRREGFHCPLFLRHGVLR